jgi:mevalonate kinase
MKKLLTVQLVNFSKVYAKLITLESRNFYSYGKLLISGEYLVLDGALALAAPVKLGQNLLVEDSDTEGLHWLATHPGGTWFEALFDLPGLRIRQSSHPEIALTLRKYLLAARSLQENFLSPGKNYKVSTYLEFNINRGLGSSSTLIANLARWAGIDPYDLLWSVSKGSGFDIACAGASGPLLYQLADKQPIVKSVNFQPPFRDSIYFVYLEKKQDSNSMIAEYRKKSPASVGNLLEISHITEDMLSAVSMEEFGQLMEEHEAILSKILDTSKIQDTLFKGFPGIVKSLGAWGGDFAMLATDIGEPEVKKQLNRIGLQTYFCFDDLLLQHPENTPL